MELANIRMDLISSTAVVTACGNLPHVNCVSIFAAAVYLAIRLIARGAFASQVDHTPES